jgi:phage protein D
MAGVKVPIFKLNIGGIDFSDSKLKKAVHKIDVERVSNGVSSFKVELVDNDRLLADANSIVEGASCEIALGFAETGTAKVIEGIVTSVKTEHAKNSYLKLVVSGEDYLHRLTRGRKRNSWETIKDADLATEIVGKAGLRMDTEDCGLINPYVSQNNITNLAFLMERGKRIGYHVRAEDQTVIFKKPNRHAEPSHRLSSNVAKSDSCLIMENCDIMPNTANSVKKVVVRSYDPKSAEPIIASADQVDAMGGFADAGTAAAKNNPDTTMQISCENVYSTEEAQLLAQAKLDLMADEFVDARVKIEGNGNVRAATVVALEDVGTEYDGNYYVQKVTHTYTVASVNRGYGYWTTLELSRTSH